MVDESDGTTASWRTFASWLAIVVVIQALGWIGIVVVFGQPTTPGAFGDMFGAVNTLFSGLAFAGVIFAIVLQRKALELQRRDLKLTREELALARVEAQRTANALESQTRLAVLTQLIPHYQQQEADAQQRIDRLDGAMARMNTESEAAAQSYYQQHAMLREMAKHAREALTECQQELTKLRDRPS